MKTLVRVTGSRMLLGETTESVGLFADRIGAPFVDRGSRDSPGKTLRQLVIERHRTNPVLRPMKFVHPRSLVPE